MTEQRSPTALGGTLALCAVGALAMLPAPVRAQGLLGDINGTPTGGVTPVANTWQQYSYGFTATLPTTYITFLFKNNPNFTGLDDIALTRTGDGTNLLANGGLEVPGAAIGSSVIIPANWTSVGTPGLSFPGSWVSGPVDDPADGGTHSGSGAWSDGAINGFDGITQAAATTVGQNYTLTFWLGSGRIPDGITIDSRVSAGLNIDTLQGSYAASQLGVTVNPILYGGTLLLDQPGATYGQNFTLDGSGSNTIDQNGNPASFSGVFSDGTPGTPGGISIVNSGSGGAVTFTGANTYTGATTIGPGATLALSGAGSIAASSGLVDNGTFDLSASHGASIRTLSGSGTVQLGGQILTLTAASGAFSGVIAGSGGLTIAAGTETLSGGNTYTGPTSIGAGATLALSGNGSIAGSSVVDNGTFDIAATGAGASIAALSGSGSVALGARTLTLTAATGTFSGTIGGAGGLTIDGGSQTLSGANTYTGATTIGGGATLALGGTGSIAGSSGVAANGTFDISNAAADVSVSSVSGSGAVALGSRSLTLTQASGSFSGTIGGAGGLTVSGGNETLTGANTYTGATSIAAGAKLGLGGAGSIAASAGVAADGTFDVSDAGGNVSIASLSGSGNIILGSQGLSFSNAADSFAGTIAGTGSLTVAGGTEIFTGSNSYTGATTIGDGATLALGGSGSIATSAGVAANGTFDISDAGANVSIASLSGSGNVVLGTRTLTLSGAAGTFSGAIGGTGGLTVNAGTERLGGVNGYTGITTIATGATLALTGNGTVATSAGVVDNGSFDISATSIGASIASLSGTGSVSLGARSLTLTAAAGGFGGAIGGTGGLTVTGGTETLSAVNTYTGPTTVGSGATLTLSGPGSIASSAGLTANGTFDVSAAGTDVSISSLDGSGTVTLGSQSLRLTNAHGEFLGNIAGTGGLSLAGGSQALGGTNAYSGFTTIDRESSLALVGNGSIAASAGVAANGTFDISTTTAGAAITTLSGSGQVALGGRTLTLTSAGGTFAGMLTGTGGITVLGGTETLTGGSTYTGATLIDHGATLALGGAGSIAQSAEVTDDGTFDISATGAGAQIRTLSGAGTVALGARTLTLTNASTGFSGTVQGAGGLAIAGGTQSLTGANTYTGGTAVTDATIAINADAALGDAAGTLSLSDATLRALAPFTSARQMTLAGIAGSVDSNGFGIGLSGVLSGTGGLNVVGGGVVTLNAISTYTGPTTIAAGTTLALAGAGSIAGSAGVADAGTFDISAGTGTTITSLSGTGSVVLGGHTLTLGNAADSFAGTIAGRGGLTIAAGTEALSGANSFTGPATIDAGATLALSGAGRLGASTRVADDGVFDISGLGGPGTSVGSLSGKGAVVLGGRSLTLTDAAGKFSGTIGGTGGLSITGGTEALTGNNTYRGGTSITNATLAIDGDAALGATSGGVSLSGGTLQALAALSSARAVSMAGGSTVNTNGTAVTLSGVVSGTGSLAATGGGRLDLTGVANTYAGGTTIAGGTTLAVSTDAALGASGGTLTFNNGTLLALGGFSSPRAILVAAGGGKVDANGFTVLLTGPITLNGALSSIGTGKVSFSNDAQVNGDLSIGNGIFSNGGTINALSVTVGTSGTLRGTGTINAPTTVNGMLAPGNSPGTLTFSAPLALAAGSISEFDIDGTGTGTGAGNYSRVLVKGSTAAVGGTLVPLLRGITGDATNTYTPPIAQTFVVMSADGGITGSYAGLTQPEGLAAGTRMDALYRPSTLTLVVTPAQYGNLGQAGLAETPTEAAIGRAIDAIRPTAGTRPSGASASLFDPLYQLGALAIAPALDQLAPTIYGDALLAARGAAHQVADSVLDQLAARRGETTRANTAAGPGGSTIWVDGMGQFSHVDGSSVPGFDASFGGAMAGIDMPVMDNARVGVAVGGGSLNTSASTGKADASLVQFSLYGGLQSGMFFADAQADYVHIDQSVRRNLAMFGTTARGNGGIDGGGAQVHAGVRLDYGSWAVEPTLGLGGSSLSGGALTETSGGGLAQQIGSQSIGSLQSFAGVRVGTRFAIAPTKPVNVHAVLGWEHEFLDTTARTTAAFGLGGGTFSASTAPVSRDAARVGAVFDVALSERIGLHAGYTAALGNRSTAQNLTGGLRIVW